MALTPREARALEDIAKQLADEDPRLVRRLAGRGRIDWDRVARQVAGPVRFRTIIVLLLLVGPAALTYAEGAVGMVVGLASYLLVFGVAMLRARIRPFTFPRARRLLESVRDDRG